MLEWTINGAYMIFGILILTGLTWVIYYAKKATNLSSELKDISEKNIVGLGTLDSNLSKLVASLEKNLNQIIKISENQNVNLENIVNDLKGIAIEIHTTLNENDKKATKLSSELKDILNKNVVALGALDSNLSKLMTNLVNNLNQIMSLQNVSNDKKINKLSIDFKDIADKNAVVLGALNTNLSKLMESLDNNLNKIMSIQNTSNEKFDKGLKISEKQNTNFEKTANDLKGIALEIHSTLNDVVKIDLS